MKKLFTVVLAALAAVTMNAEVMTFAEGSTLGDNATFSTSNLTATLTDTGSKFAIDANSCYFNPAAPVKFASRLKSGGKSGSALSIKLTATEAGTLKVYARTGSNSATDRNVVLTQNGTELLNHVMLESEKTENVTVEGESNPQSVYPVLEATVAAGDIMVTFPVGSINFYGFELVAGEGPTPGPGPETSNDYKFNALTADDFTNKANAADTTYTMDGNPNFSLNYTATDNADMAFDCRGVHFTYKNSAAQKNVVKMSADYIQFDKKNFVMTLSGVNGKNITFKVAAKGSTNATFTVVSGGTLVSGDTQAQASSLATYGELVVSANADQLVVKEGNGGFRMTEIVISDAPATPKSQVYFINSDEWETVNAYAWTGDVKNADWPGEAMAKAGTIGDYDVYVFKADSAKYANVIFNNGTNQTADLVWEHNQYYDSKTAQWYDEAAAKALYKKTHYDYPTIAELCNYVDFQVVPAGTAVPSSTNKGTEEEPNWEEKDVYTFTNGTQVMGSQISASASSWNTKEDYNTKFKGYAVESDTILFGSQFRGVSGARIVLGEFEVSADAEIQVYWQPNGTSERGVKFVNLYDEEDVKEDVITFADKSVFVISTFPVKKGYYDHEIQVMVMKNTINIAGINITNLVEAIGDALENVEEAPKAEKFYENGQIVIVKDGVRYNVLGVKL